MLACSRKENSWLTDLWDGLFLTRFQKIKQAGWIIPLCSPRNDSLIQTHRQGFAKVKELTFFNGEFTLCPCFQSTIHSYCIKNSVPVLFNDSIPDYSIIRSVFRELIGSAFHNQPYQTRGQYIRRFCFRHDLLPLFYYQTPLSGVAFAC